MRGDLWENWEWTQASRNPSPLLFNSSTHWLSNMHLFPRTGSFFFPYSLLDVIHTHVHKNTLGHTHWKIRHSWIRVHSSFYKCSQLSSTQLVSLHSPIGSPTVVVVLQGLQHAGRLGCPQLGQSAAGGAQLRAQVGHLLAGGLNGPIDALGQLLVVIHHFQDFCLRRRGESRQGVMLTSWPFPVKEGVPE